MNPAQVLDVIARLEVAYRTELTDPERRLWLEELEPFDAQLIAAAAEDRITSSSPFMPKVGEIMAAVREALEEAPRDRPALPSSEADLEAVPMPDDMRAKIRELVESPEWEWGARVDEALARPRLRGVCSGVGKRPVQSKGVLVCPDCGSPVADGCRPVTEVEA